MIISQTPYRISFFGGGTDFPLWYREHGGCSLGCTIDKYCYISCRYLPDFFDHKSRLVYSQIELVKDNLDIEHPSIRETLRFLELSKGVEIHHFGDLPARSGIGSSSSFTVGLLNAMSGLLNRQATKGTLTSDSIHIEQNMIKEHVGSQDQTFVTHGGINFLEFEKSGEIKVVSLPISASRITEFNSHLMLFFTGVTRFSSEFAKKIINAIPEKSKELHQMKEYAIMAKNILNSDSDILDFGRLMNECWEIKKSLSPSISNPEIDAIYQRAQQAGAVGGKILGAGGGGFLLLFAPPEKKEQIIQELSPSILHVPFQFENKGSRIVANSYI